MQTNYARYPGVVVKRLGPWQNKIRLIVHLRTVPTGAVVFLFDISNILSTIKNKEALL